MVQFSWCLDDLSKFVFTVKLAHIMAWGLPLSWLPSAHRAPYMSVLLTQANLLRLLIWAGAQARPERVGSPEWARVQALKQSLWPGWISIWCPCLREAKQRVEWLRQRVRRPLVCCQFSRWTGRACGTDCNRLGEWFPKDSWQNPLKTVKDYTHFGCDSSFWLSVDGSLQLHFKEAQIIPYRGRRCCAMHCLVAGTDHISLLLAQRSGFGACCVYKKKGLKLLLSALTVHTSNWIPVVSDCFVPQC